MNQPKKTFCQLEQYDLEQEVPSRPKYRKYSIHPHSNRSFQSILNALSFDVALGAVLSSALAAKILRVTLPAAWLFILPGVVWVIYTLDHLVDSSKPNSDLVNFRYKVHKDWHQILFALMALVGLLTFLAAILLLPRTMLIFGLILSLLVGCYLFATHLNCIFIRGECVKEICVAVIYTLGIWGGPFLIAGTRGSAYGFMLLLSFFCMALVNLYLISFFETEQDKKMGFTSAATVVARTTLITRLRWLSCLSLVTCGVGIIWVPEALRLATTMLGLGASVLTVMVFWPEYFRKGERYREIADAVFVISPFLALLSA